MALPKYVAFDCESTGLLDTDALICIAAIEYNYNDSNKRVFYSSLGTIMTQCDVRAFILYLWEKNLTGYTIVSFNGVGFDFKKLAHCVQDDITLVEKVELLALGSQDIMLDFATEHGYYAGMQSFALGCGLDGKSHEGAWAPQTWLHGTPEQQREVLAYCMQDVQVLCELVQFREQHGRLYRQSKAGKRILWVPCAFSFRVAHECISTFIKTPVVPTWFKKDTAPCIYNTWAWLL